MATDYFKMALDMSREQARRVSERSERVQTSLQGGVEGHAATVINPCRGEPTSPCGRLVGTKAVRCAGDEQVSSPAPAIHSDEDDAMQPWGLA